MSRIKFALGLTLLLIVILLLPRTLTSSTREVYLRLTRPFLSFLFGTSQTVLHITRLGAIVEENKMLRKEADSLRISQFDLKELDIENRRLRLLLDFRERAVRKWGAVITCQVIGRNPIAWRQSILIDKGSQEGVKDGMPVITEAGLVGKVEDAAPHTSKVKLITHPRFKIGALVQEKRYMGLVFGTLDGECRMKYLALEADIQKGDLVETAGLTEGFPKGILIGTIDTVWKEPGQLYKVASIHLSADIDRLEEVLSVAP